MSLGLKPRHRRLRSLEIKKKTKTVSQFSSKSGKFCSQIRQKPIKLQDQQNKTNPQTTTKDFHKTLKSKPQTQKLNTQI